MKLHKKLIITGKMTLLTGLHIGDSKDNVEIGGVDNPVVRRKDNNEPYIPGSSLKGKLRSLLEVALGENADTSFKNYSSDTGKVLAYLFGSAAKDGMPSRLLVRDAYLTRELNEKGELTGGWAKLLYDSEFTDMPYTEVKFENTIDRIKGTALNPRQTERIPAGAEFIVEFVVNIITPTTKKDDEGKRVPTSDEDQKAEAARHETDFLNLLQDGIRLLEDDYLGGSGTRGYGQVMFDFNNWQDGKAEQKTEKGGESRQTKIQYPIGITHKSAESYLLKSSPPSVSPA